MNGLNKVVRSMPSHLVINIGCQKPKELEDYFQLLGNWVIAKRASDDTMIVRYVAILITSCFICLAWDWWRWLLIETKEEILNSPTIDSNLIISLSNQFYGFGLGIDYDHLDSLFMSQILGHLAYHKQYYCYILRTLFGKKSKQGF
jgi:hypothetical protein